MKDLPKFDQMPLDEITFNIGGAIE